ncbi:unnamed protein product [Malus baccata var. baccata]
MESRRSCFAITFIKGIGRRFTDIFYKKADLKIHDWFFNRKDYEDGKYSQVVYKDGYYGVSVFIISNLLSSFPFLVAITLSIWGNLDQMIESLMMVLAFLVPNFLMGIITFEHPDDDLGPLRLVGLGCFIPIWSFDTTRAFVCVDRDLWFLKKRHCEEEKEGNDTR